MTQAKWQMYSPGTDHSSGSLPSHRRRDDGPVRHLTETHQNNLLRGRRTYWNTCSKREQPRGEFEAILVVTGDEYR
jgi:hypothetical protein